MPTVSLFNVRGGMKEKQRLRGEANRKTERQSCRRKEEFTGTRVALPFSPQDEGMPSSVRDGFVSLIDRTCGRKRKEEQVQTVSNEFKEHSSVPTQSIQRGGKEVLLQLPLSIV